MSWRLFGLQLRRPINNFKIPGVSLSRQGQSLSVCKCRIVSGLTMCQRLAHYAGAVFSAETVASDTRQRNLTTGDPKNNLMCALMCREGHILDTGRGRTHPDKIRKRLTMAPTQTKQQHIDTCSAHANPTWKSAALAATMRVARQRRQFTSYDVLQELANSNVKTHDLRAIGAVMQEARDLEIIESVGLVRRNDRHSRGATTLWQSKVVAQPSETTLPESQ